MHCLGVYLVFGEDKQRKLRLKAISQFPLPNEGLSHQLQRYRGHHKRDSLRLEFPNRGKDQSELTRGVHLPEVGHFGK